MDQSKIEKRRQYQRDYYHRNKSKILEKQRVYSSIYNKKYYEQNKDKLIEERSNKEKEILSIIEEHWK